MDPYFALRSIEEQGFVPLRGSYPRHGQRGQPQPVGQHCVLRGGEVGSTACANAALCTRVGTSARDLKGGSWRVETECAHPVAAPEPRAGSLFGASQGARADRAAGSAGQLLEIEGGDLQAEALGW